MWKRRQPLSHKIFANTQSLVDDETSTTKLTKEKEKGIHVMEIWNLNYLQYYCFG